MLAAIFTSPIVARLHNSKEPIGNRLAELYFNPTSEMYFCVLVKYFPLVLVISVGVHHLISPCQNLATVVLGVPPLTISASSPTFLTPHSSLNPGNRILPVRSCCIVASLISRFLA